MDAVNRRISMRMMVSRDLLVHELDRNAEVLQSLQIDTANASDCKQYVLITPQDMTNVQIGPTVRVHRMSDPERGQGTLAFS